MSLVLIGVFFVLAIFAIPIAHALLAASAVSIGIFNPKVINVIVERMVSQSQSFPLIAIPFFMITGSLMMGGKLGQSIDLFLYLILS